MATEPLPMRNIREILRLKWVAQRSHREAARNLGVSVGAVAAAVGRARARALTWEAVEALRDEALERLLYGPTAAEIDGTRPESIAHSAKAERAIARETWSIELCSRAGPSELNIARSASSPWVQI
jgi:hypothetical protein